MKKFLLLAIILILAVILISCSTPKQIVKETTSKYPDIVKLTLDGERKNSSILFYGTTNLPDGVLLAYELSIPKQEVFSYFGEQGNLIIKDGKYSFKANNVPDGIVEVWVSFQTILGTDVENKQPQGVIDKYGETGEKIKGDNLTVTEFEDGDFKRIELIINI